MVNTLVIYDVARKADRQRLEGLLRAHQFVWLFPFARWSSKALGRHPGLLRGVRACLRSQAHRVLFIECSDKNRARAKWLTATNTR